ncbi:MAG: hypothetical protein IPM61_08975 [Chlorobi bacterium]|nr:hypothetical protein [Chlorobiota bacterium]
MIARLIFPTAVLLLLLGVSATAQPASQPTDSAAMASKLFAAFRNADWKELRALLPSVAVVRAVAPKETKKLKNKQIIRQMEGRIRPSFNQIIAEAKKKGIELGKLEFLRFQTSRPWEGANKPLAVEVSYRWEGREGTLSFSVMEYQGRWYLLEILRSVNVFDDVMAK